MLAWPCFSTTGHLAIQGQTHGNGSPLKIALRWHGTYQWLRKRVLVEESVGRSLTSCRLWAPKRGFQAAEALPQAEELNVTRSVLVNAQRLIEQVCHHLCPHLRLLHTVLSKTARPACFVDCRVAACLRAVFPSPANPLLFHATNFPSPNYCSLYFFTRASTIVLNQISVSHIEQHCYLPMCRPSPKAGKRYAEMSSL